MSRSTLSIKISIAQLVETLNDDACIDVIRLLQNELGWITLRTMINQIIAQFTNTRALTNESLIKIEKTIKDTYSSHSTNNKISTINNNNITRHNVLFPLSRLPNDLIFKTSLFLNEKDIFQFEQCCRLFYKMINNTSYLMQCDNFKQFIITKKRLCQMRQERYSFFKYSKANRLEFWLTTQDYHDEKNVFDEKRLLVAVINGFETTMNEMKKIGSYDNWWTSLLKSISTLDISTGTNIGALLYVMPIEKLFDPNESHLKKIELVHFIPCGRGLAWNNYMNKFEEKYLQFKKNLEKKGLKIKSLQCIKHIYLHISRISPTMNPRYIDSKHVWINQVEVDLADNKILTNKCNPGMKIVTFDSWIDFVSHSNSYRNVASINRGLTIETMRILSHYCGWANVDICNNKVVIESLNLHNSLKNLTIEFMTSISYDYESYEHQQKALNNVILKTYYYNLENVNILVEMAMMDNVTVDWFFTLLKKNHKVLKHQFKQLKIAIVKNINIQLTKHKLYFVLEWNSGTDDKKLNQAKKQVDEMTIEDENQKQYQEQYLLMRTQWLNN